MSLSRSDLEAGNEQTRLLEGSHSGIKLIPILYEAPNYIRNEPQRAHSRSVSSEKDTKKQGRKPREFGAASQKNSITTLSKEELQRSLDETLQQHPPNSDIWIFAYGSLIWNPLIAYVERRAGIVYASVHG